MKAFNSLTRFFQSRPPADTAVGEPEPSSEVQNAWSGICITGAHPADLACVANILFCAGMQNARPAEGHAQPVDMHYWHAQVVTGHDRAGGAQPQQLSYQPGQMWERLATEVFMANLGSPVWGWADTRSTWLLDFWKKFEPRLQFILVTSGLQSMMARLLMEDANETDTKQFIDQWVATHQHLLQFAKNNPKRVMLVDAADVAANPDAFIKACVRQWSLALSSGSLPEPGTYPQDLLATHLATQICEAYPQAVDLQRALSSSLVYLSERSTATALSTLQGLPSAYQNLRKRSLESDALQERLGQLESEHGTKIQKLTHENEMLSKQLQALNEQIKKAKEASAENLKELTQENELLLKQLHQVQEELESYFLKNEAHKKSLESKDKEISTLKSQATATQKNIDDLKKTSSELTKSRDEQLKLATDRKKQVDDLTKAAADLTKARDEHVKLATDRKKQLDEQTSQLTQIRTELTQLQSKHKQLQEAQKESEQEGELLLKQLHQVQEELERYFLESRNQQQSNKKLQARMEALFKKNPDLFDFDSIELISPPAGDKQFARWRMSGLAFGSRVIPDFEFNTLIVQGVAGLVLLRSGDDSGPLLRWPSSQADGKELVLAPMGKPETLALRLAPFYELSATDWDFLRVLVKAMLQVLAQPQTIAGSKGLLAAPLNQAIEAYKLVMDKLPSAARFDQIRLKHEQTNPDYEHILLEVNNLQAGTKRLDSFAFRISCAYLTPGGPFGNFPKIEFPESTARLAFDNWFEESADDFGPKLELRLQVPNTIDALVWRRMASADQEFVRLLVDQLPRLVRISKPSDRKTGRSWEQWVDVADRIQKIFAAQPSTSKVQLNDKLVAPQAKPLALSNQPKADSLLLPEIPAALPAEPIASEITTKAPTVESIPASVPSKVTASKRKSAVTDDQSTVVKSKVSSPKTKASSVNIKAVDTKSKVIASKSKSTGTKSKMASVEPKAKPPARAQLPEVKKRGRPAVRTLNQS